MTVVSRKHIVESGPIRNAQRATFLCRYSAILAESKLGMGVTRERTGTGPGLTVIAAMCCILETRKLFDMGVAFSYTNGIRG